MNLTHSSAIKIAGKLRQGAKSELLTAMRKLSVQLDDTNATNILHQSLPSDNIDGESLEGSVLANILKPGKQSTLADYANDTFISNISGELENTGRVDLVFHHYIKGSLKATTRKARGAGVRTKVEAQSQAPSNWQSFLRIVANKQELFQYRSREIVSRILSSKAIVTAFENAALSKNYLTFKG